MGTGNVCFPISPGFSFEREVWESAESHPWPQRANQTKLSPWRSWRSATVLKLENPGPNLMSMKISLLPLGILLSSTTGLVLPSRGESWHTLMSGSNNQKHVVGFSFPQFALWKWQAFIFVLKYEIIMPLNIHFQTTPHPSQCPREFWELWWIFLSTQPEMSLTHLLNLVQEKRTEDA